MNEPINYKQDSLEESVPQKNYAGINFVFGDLYDTQHY
jgi:hypothetical protein